VQLQQTPGARVKQEQGENSDPPEGGSCDLETGRPPYSQ